MKIQKSPGDAKRHASGEGASARTEGKGAGKASAPRRLFADDRHIQVSEPVARRQAADPQPTAAGPLRVRFRERKHSLSEATTVHAPSGGAAALLAQAIEAGIPAPRLVLRLGESLGLRTDHRDLREVKALGEQICTNQDRLPIPELAALAEGLAALLLRGPGNAREAMRDFAQALLQAPCTRLTQDRVAALMLGLQRACLHAGDSNREASLGLDDYLAMAGADLDMDLHAAMLCARQVARDAHIQPAVSSGERREATVPAPRRGPATPAYRLGALMAREPWRLVPTDGSPSLRQALLLETAYGLMAMESPQRLRTELDLQVELPATAGRTGRLLSLVLCGRSHGGPGAFAQAQLASGDFIAMRNAHLVNVSRLSDAEVWKACSTDDAAGTPGATTSAAPGNETGEGPETKSGPAGSGDRSRSGEAALSEEALRSLQRSLDRFQDEVLERGVARMMDFITAFAEGAWLANLERPRTQALQPYERQFARAQVAALEALAAAEIEAKKEPRTGPPVSYHLADLARETARRIAERLQEAGD